MTKAREELELKVEISLKSPFSKEELERISDRKPFKKLVGIHPCSPLHYTTII